MPNAGPRPFIFLAGLFAAATLVFVTGCEPKEPKTTSAPQVSPETMPAEATVPLDQLMPPIPTPSPAKEVEKLPTQAQKTVEQAEALLAKGKHAQAMAKFERAVGFAPNSARIRRGLALAYWGMENYGKAQENLEKALKVAPDDQKAQLLLGQLYAGQKQYADAIRAYRTALVCSGAAENDSLTGEAMFRLGVILGREGYYRAALDSYTRLGALIEKHGRLLADNPALKPLVLEPARLFTERGRLLMKLHRPEEAAKLLARAHKRDRTNLRTARLLMTATIASDRPDRAEKLLIEMAAVPAQRPQLQVFVEALVAKTKDFSLPRRFWRACREKNVMTPSLALALASLAESAGSRDEASEILKVLLDENPSNVAAARMLVRMYAQNGKADKAMGLLARTIADNPAATQTVRGGLNELVSIGLADDFERRFAQSIEGEKLEIRHALRYVTGVLAARRGKKLLATRQFQRSIDLLENFLPPYDALMDIYVQRGRRDQATALLKRIRKLGGKGYFYPYAQGKAALGDGRLATAMEKLKLAHKRNKRHLPTVMLLAKAYVRSGQPKQATDVLFRAIQDNPDEVEVYRRLFDLCMTGRNYQAATAVASRLLQRQPGNANGRIMQARVSIARGNRDEAKKILDEILRKAPANAEAKILSLKTNLNLSGGMLFRRDYDSAVKTLDKIVRMDPRNTDARRLLIELHFSAGLFDRAAVSLAQLHQATPRDTATMRAYVLALMRSGEYKSARQVIADALKQNGDDAILRRSMIRVLGRLDEHKKAVGLVKEWLGKTTSNPSKQLLRLTLLEVLTRDEKYDAATVVLDDWYAESNDDSQKRALKIEKARLLTEAKKYDEAQKLLDKMIAGEKNPKNLRRLRLRKARTFGLDKEFAEAHKILDALIEDADADAEEEEIARSTKLVMYAQAKDFAKAEEFASRWMTESPDSLTPQQMLVAIFVDAEKYAEALEHVAKWTPKEGATSRPAKLDKVQLWACEMRVRLLMMQRKFKVALELAENYAKLAPKNYELLGLASSCLSELGRHKEAISMMEKSLDVVTARLRSERDGKKRRMLGMDVASTQNNLGYMYAERGVNLKKAQELLSKCLLVRPEITAYQDSMAWIHYMQGRFRESGRRLQRLVERKEDENSPEHPVIYDHAGDVFYRLGWTGKALAMWKRAAELGKKDKKPSPDTRRLLKTLPDKIRDFKRGRRPEVAPTAEEMQSRNKK